MTAQISAAHEDLRVQVRGALARIVEPHAEKWEAQRYIDRSGWRALGDAGLFELPHAGEGFLRSSVLIEELGRTGFAGVRAAVGVHAYMALSYVELFGTPAQRDRFVPPARRGEHVLGLAISEDGAGSDLRHLATVATPTGDAFRVTGEKWWVSNGSQADHLVTLVRTRSGGAAKGLTGVSFLLIDTDSPGITRHTQPMLGWHSADVTRIVFDDVAVPADRLIGRQDRALLHIMAALDFERLVAGLLAVGGIGYCLDLLGRFSREHQIRDAPLSANQAVRHRIADLTADYELIREYAYHAAWLHAQGRLTTRVASIVKLKATELAVSAAQACVQFHGARGYVESAAAGRLYRDAIAGTIAAGASELMRDMIFEAA